MAGTRPPISRPVVYAALLSFGLIALYLGIRAAGPGMDHWFRQRGLRWQLARASASERVELIHQTRTMPWDAAAPALLDAVRDPDAAVRLAASRELAMHADPPPESISVLTAAAEHRDLAVRSESAEILGLILARRGQKAPSESGGSTDTLDQPTSLLGRLVKDPNDRVRYEAAKALGEGFGPAPDALTGAANDSSRDVRAATAASLLRRNGPDDATAARLLAELFSDPAPVSDRFELLRWVKELSPSARDQAFQALASAIPRADSAAVPDMIACLGESGPGAAATIPALEKMLDDGDPHTRATAAMAILAIVESPSPRVLTVLVEMIAMKDLPLDQRQDALGRIREADPRSLVKPTPALIRQLGDASPEIRHAAVELLGSIVEDTPAEIPSAPTGR